MTRDTRRFLSLFKQDVQGLPLFKDNMSVNFRSVLISDPVDESCGALLAEYGIPVTTKYKLPKDELISELQVGGCNRRKICTKERAILRALLSQSEHRNGSSSYEVINSAQYPTSKIGYKNQGPSLRIENVI